MESVAICIAETVTVRPAEWLSEPLDPVTVTVKGPDAVELNVSVEDAVPPEVRVTLAGLSEVVGPDGEAVAVRETVPLKLFTLVRVTVDVTEDPAEAVIDVGLIAIAKSGEVDTIPTGTEFEVVPVAPFESVTVRVTV